MFAETDIRNRNVEQSHSQKDLSTTSLNFEDGIEKCSITSFSPCTSPMSSQGGIYTVTTDFY